MRLFRQKRTLILLAILAAAAGWKILLLAMSVFPFNADEAIVALMARHILQGARPVFFYGQAYMGSLDAFLVSLGFFLLGEQVWVIRLIQLLLYLLTIITTVLVANVMFESNRIGLFAAAIMAVPVVNVTLYTTVSLGGYGESLLIGCLLLLVSLMLRRRLEGDPLTSAISNQRVLSTLTFLFGLLTGLGLWANGLTLVFALPAGLLWVVTAWRKRSELSGNKRMLMLLALLTGFIIGSAPWWIHAGQVGWDTLLVELFGSAVAVEQGAWMMRILAHIFNFSVLGMTAALGLRPPWEVRWLALPLMPLALAFWLSVLVFTVRQSIRKTPHRGDYHMLAGVLLAVTAGFILTPFGTDPSGRYFLPFVIPLALAAAHMVDIYIKNIKWQAAVIGVVLGFNLWGTLQCALRYPPGMTTQFDLNTAIDHRYTDELMQFLLEKDERVGYSNYWVSYPLAFLSGEQLIYAPRLPYHQDLRYSERDDRYRPYYEIAAASQTVAYITTRNAALDNYLRTAFTRLNIIWEEEQIGDYRVYYRLSRSVHPQEIGLGRTTP